MESSIDRAVCVIQGEGFKKKIVAFVTGTPEKNEVAKALAARLPDYMVPSAISAIAEFPLNENGKLDRRALEKREAQVSVRRRELSVTELVVAEVFSSKIGLEVRHPEDDFFEMGGSSLVAVLTCALLSERMDVDLSVSVLLETSTVSGLAQWIDKAKGANGFRESRFNPLVQFHPGTAEDATPIFLVHGSGGGVLDMRLLARNLGDFHPVYALRGQGSEGRFEPLTSIEEMSCQYVDALESLNPKPFILMGFSSGGMVAFSMAMELSRRGRPPLGVVMYDAVLDRSDFYSLQRVWERNITGLKTQGVGYLRWKLNVFAKKGALKANRAMNRGVPPELGGFNLTEQFYAMRQEFVPKFLDIPIGVLSTGTVTADPAMGWGDFGRVVSTLYIEGEHSSCLKEPQVVPNAKKVKDMIAAIERERENVARSYKSTRDHLPDNCRV
jgi:thioesterase domain-containing protein